MVASGYELRSQLETRFKLWTKNRNGSDILNGRGQRPFSSVFPFSVFRSFCLFVCLSVCLSLCLCLSVSVCLSALGPLKPGYSSAGIIEKNYLWFVLKKLKSHPVDLFIQQIEFTKYWLSGLRMCRHVRSPQKPTNDSRKFGNFCKHFVLLRFCSVILFLLQNRFANPLYKVVELVMLDVHYGYENAQIL